jgi:hypothetical protein
MINRRGMLQMLGGLSLGATAIPTFGAGELQFDNPPDFLTAITKMRGSTDDRLVMGWVIGTRYAVVRNKATPMMGILAATFSRYRRINPTTYEARALEIAYFTDLRTGKLLETWQNPFTGKTVEVPLTRMGPARLLMTADGLQVETTGEASGMALHHSFRPAVIQGDFVWITEEINVEGSRPGTDSKPFVYNEMSTYQSRLSDLENPELATVPTNIQFHGLVTYRPWMGFGDTPGHTTSQGAGLRVGRVEDLPPYYLELTERLHPGVLDDPLAALEPDSD